MRKRSQHTYYTLPVHLPARLLPHPHKHTHKHTHREVGDDAAGGAARGGGAAAAAQPRTTPRVAAYKHDLHTGAQSASTHRRHLGWLSCWLHRHNPPPPRNVVGGGGRPPATLPFMPVLWQSRAHTLAQGQRTSCGGGGGGVGHTLCAVWLTAPQLGHRACRRRPHCEDCVSLGARAR